MCAIVGFVGSDPKAFEKRLHAMMDIQVHRGKNARGAKFFKSCALGHLRTSIIDLTDAANQPMSTPDNRWTVIFNGEIFNYVELRSELESLGVKFRTQSDTEVLLLSWAQWGPSCLDKFIGMFAFALWDDQEQVLHGARDRWGLKPFHYVDGPGGFLFSSEIKGLFVAGVERAPNDDIWATYLLTGHSDHTDETFFKGIRQVPPAHRIEVRRGEAPKFIRYWELPEPFSRKTENPDYRESCLQLRDLIKDSVKVHLRTDLQRGVFLSGGVDSAVILASLREAGFPDIEGFNFDFPGPYSERKWVEELSAIYGTHVNYHTWEVDRIWKEFDYHAWHMEGPLGGLLYFAIAELYIMGMRRNVGVFYDGSGSDDLFGGTRVHHLAHLMDLKEGGDPDVYGLALASAGRFWGEDINKLEKQIAVLTSRTGDHYGNDMTLPVNVSVVSDKLKRAHVRPVVRRSCRSRLAEQMVLGITQSKLPRNTRFEDRLAASFSVELRSPFLDHRLAEFVTTIPGEFLFQGGYTKSILRDAMKGLVPDSVLYAVKREIQSPQREWLGHPLKNFVLPLFKSESFASRGYVDAAKVVDYYENHYLNNRVENSFPVWQWINLETWHRQFIDASLEDIKRRPRLGDFVSLGT